MNGNDDRILITDAINAPQSRLYTSGKVYQLGTHAIATDQGSVFVSTRDRIAAVRINDIVQAIHAGNEKWWQDLVTKELLNRNVGELMMLVVTELGEGYNGYRKDQMDDHLPHRKMLECELADAVIRIFDLAGGLGFDLGNAIVEKQSYNKVRIDHKHENRILPGGKKF